MLVSLAREGDTQAFEQLVVRNQSKLRVMLRRMCGQDSLADDLAQQSFLQAYTKISSLRDEKVFPGWLKRIAVNTWLQHCRKHDLLEDATESTEEQTTAIAEDGLSLDLATAMERLSTLERLCITLSYQEGMSHSEISETTRLPLGTVKSHIKRGGEKLNTLLQVYR